MSRASTVVIYEGPSLIDGKTPIVAILSGITDPSSNAKTGPLAQLWVMLQDASHGEGLKTGQDAGVCGACPFTGGNGCYVTGRSVSAIWKAYRAGAYGAPVDPSDAADMVLAQIRRGIIRGIRLGAYGDPVALPLDVVERLAIPIRDAGAAVTGYTHAWRIEYRLAGQPEPDPEWRRYLMASCHHRRDAESARLQGWRPFTILPEPPEGADPHVWATNQARAQGVALCPAGTERAEELRISCASCGGCNGSKGLEDRRVGFGTTVHGNCVTLRAARKYQGAAGESCQ